MEPVATVRRNFTIPSQQEFLMQGSIMDTSCEVLLHRLRGLCDNADENPETFHDYELVFQIRGPTGTPLVLRARQALDHPEMPWHLRYIGQPEIGDKNRATMIRSCIDVDSSNNVLQFLNELGFRLDYEYVLKGFMFRKGRMKVTVAKVCRLNAKLEAKVPEKTTNLKQAVLIFYQPSICSHISKRTINLQQPNNPESIETVSQSYLVELSVVAPSGQEALADEMKAFSEQLKPLVQLDKIDHRRLQHV